MNKCILMGNLCRDLETRVVGTDKQATVAEFTLALDASFRTKAGEMVKKAEFIDCEIWDTGAEMMTKYFAKGDKVLVEGRLRTDSWEKDGVKKYRTFVRVERFEFCGKSRTATDTPVTDAPVTDAPVSNTPEVAPETPATPF